MQVTCKSKTPKHQGTQRFHSVSKTACRGFKSFCPCQKSTCHFCGGCFCFGKKGLEPARVCALRKQFCKLFLAQSARRVLKFKEFRSPSGKKLLCNFGQVLLPLPKRKTSLSRCLSFLYVVKLALRGTRSVPGIAAEAPPMADTARR